MPCKSEKKPWRSWRKHCITLEMFFEPGYNTLTENLFLGSNLCLYTFMFFSIFFLCMIYACSRLVCWFWRVSWWVMIRTTVWHHWFGVQAVQAEERQIGSRQFCAGLRALRFEGWSLKIFKRCVEQSKVELATGSCVCLHPHFLRHILRHIRHLFFSWWGDPELLFLRVDVDKIDEVTRNERWKSVRT